MKNKYVFYFLLIYLLFSPAAVFAQEGNVSEVLFQEIANGKTLDIFPFLPAVQLPLGISVHFFMLLISAGLILALFFYGKRNISLKPRGLLVVLENMITFVQDDIVFPIMGEDKGAKWLPFFCTLFFFLLTINLLGLIPCFKTATGNINVTSALAAMILILVFAVGIKNLGIRKFFVNLYPQGTVLPIGIFVAFLEFTGMFLKTAVLSLRLFANMFAGHLAIFSFLMLIFILSPFAGIFAVPFTIFTYLLEVLVSLIQAFVFTLLSCIFITMASSVHE
ncbi:MAG: F0F1 ATP synthase subunit A [Candidatus Omnitrophica bacterium]|nr:F0F1 ATP synthase subunit A [Candidatus Omnitrophota bacterium]